MINSIYKNDVRCPEINTAKKMKDSILDAKKKGDSLGGIIESITTKIPVGLGEPVFGSLESDLSKAIFSIPSVKGIEFGSGFRGSELYGSENNDLYTIKNGKIITKTNNSGGILGGISNGMPITMRIAFKPASSIAQKQSTIDIKTKKETILQVKGRHDPCVVPRAPPVVDSLVALTIADHALISGVIKPVL
jgi:chorismate synthase